MKNIVKDNAMVVKQGHCTQKELAELLSISQVTVHRALRDHTSVKPAVRQRVLEAADRLGYRRNEMARAMVTGKSRVLGYINNNPSSEVQSRIMAGAQEESDRYDYLIKLLHVPITATEDDIRSAVTRCVEHRVAGIMASLPPELLPVLRSESARYGIPVGLLDDVEADGWGIRVSTNDTQGIRLAVEHLAELGHQDIAMISGPYYSALASMRLNSFRATMKELSLPLREESIVASEWAHTVLNGIAVHRVLDLKPRPTAIVCSSDYIAMTVLRVAYEMELRVPRDLSVIGYSNLSFADVASPALTTVSQPFEELGRVAVRRLLEVQEGGDNSNQMCSTELLPTKLIVRGSTKAPPARIEHTSE